MPSPRSTQGPLVSAFCPPPRSLICPLGTLGSILESDEPRKDQWAETAHLFERQDTSSPTLPPPQDLCPWGPSPRPMVGPLLPPCYTLKRAWTKGMNTLSVPPQLAHSIPLPTRNVMPWLFCACWQPDLWLLLVPSPPFISCSFSFIQ